MPGKSGFRLGGVLVCFVSWFIWPSTAQSQSLDDTHVTPRTSGEVKIASGASIPDLRQRPLRKDVDLVLVPVTVTDAIGHPIIDLSQKDFLLYEDDSQQRIQYFSAEDAPLSIALVLDFSASMKNKVEYEKQAIDEFFGNANPNDEYFCVTVSTKPQLVAAATMTIEGLQSKVAMVEPHGGTALFDGIFLALQQLRNAKYRRKALLVISDGGDNDSRYTLKEIRSLVSESDVTMYAIGLFDDVPLPVFKTFEERWGRKWLGSITDVSGGRTIAADSRAEIPQIASIISRELRYQYLLGYRPGGASQDGKWRKVVVKTALPEQRAVLRVHYKQGYFAPIESK